MQFFVLQFVRTHKNEITILLFVQQKRKHGEMVRVNTFFLLLVLILQPEMPVKAGILT